MRPVRLRPEIWKGNTRIQHDWRIDPSVPNDRMEEEVLRFLESLVACLIQHAVDGPVRVDVVDHASSDLLHEGACVIHRGDHPSTRVQALADAARGARQR